MSISKRIWDLARSNVTDFRQAFSRDEMRDLLSEEEREAIEREVRDSTTVGAKAGRKAREFRDAAEEAWERAYDAARHRAGAGGPRGVTEVDRRRWYRTLELQPGATVPEVRKAYRRLLIRYHPDRHASDPERYQVATEITRRITEAYNGLTRDLGG